ncbi:MAG: hypothetical protein JST67_11510 [Bacteroidetes bacterium]|nr:hypothetical protein [Bacteroidota bacterium]
MKRWHFVSAFLLKIAAGFFLTWVYTNYYPDRQTADVFKYYDDSKIMYTSVQKKQYTDYAKMLLGVANNTPYFDSTYYNKMNHWYRHYDFGSYNDNHTIIRFNALVMLFSFQNFYVHTVFMCFLCFLGLTALFKTFAPYFIHKEVLLFLTLFFVPSVVFWSSGVLKEGILFFSLGFLFYACFHLFFTKGNRWLHLFTLVLSSWLLLINKNYLLLSAAPALLCFFLTTKFHLKKTMLFYGLFYTLSFLFIFFLSTIISEKNILENFSIKQRDFINVAKGGVFIQNNQYFARIDPDKKFFLDTLAKNQFKIKAGSRYMYWKNENLNDTLYTTYSKDTASYHLVWDLPVAQSTVSIGRIKPTFFSLLQNAPQALYNSLCKPSLASAKTFLEKISAMENALVLLFLMLCVCCKKETYNKNVMALCFFMAFIILLLIGYTTPVAGAINRYKIPILPFLLMCGLTVLDENKLKARLYLLMNKKKNHIAFKKTE